MTSDLAIYGGKREVSYASPHEIWPPIATRGELREISKQRNTDIGIRGRTGPIKEFEENFLEFLNHELDYAVSFNSGTSALLAAYFALGIEDGDEIIGPALTYHAALSPVFFLKGNVRLADIDPKSRCIDPVSIERLIGPRTKGIVVVHQWGHPADMDAIMAIAKRHNLFVLEDCSHAHGSSYKGRLCGTFGDAAVFSLQTNKAIFAGEGGIFVTNNQRLYERATLLGHYRDRSRDEVNTEDHNKYWVTGFGLKLRMSPFNAIVAKHSLARFPKLKRGRHKCLNYFNDQIKKISFLEPVYIASEVDMGAWYGFKPLYIKEKLNNLPKHRLIDVLRAEGVEVSDPSGPVLSTLPLYSEEVDMMFKRRGPKTINPETQTPCAFWVEERALSLPTFSNWRRDKKIIDSYIRAFKKVEMGLQNAT